MGMAFSSIVLPAKCILGSHHSPKFPRPTGIHSCSTKAQFNQQLLPLHIRSKSYYSYTHNFLSNSLITPLKDDLHALMQWRPLCYWPKQAGMTNLHMGNIFSFTSSSYVCTRQLYLLYVIIRGTLWVTYLTHSIPDRPIMKFTFCALLKFIKSHPSSP